ncbi:MAG TPA: RNA polymerase sigma factor [Tepidisphaeraceae bacterium]|nr:RNA polymerase sigma factor [Tepidisphaeraceae bacterium]
MARLILQNVAMEITDAGDGGSEGTMLLAGDVEQSRRVPRAMSQSEQAVSPHRAPGADPASANGAIANGASASGASANGASANAESAAAAGIDSAGADAASANGAGAGAADADSARADSAKANPAAASAPGGAGANAVAGAEPRENHPAMADREPAAAPADFEALVAEHEPRIRRLAYRLLGWRGGGVGDASGDVDDVVQDVFLAALTHLDRLRGHASVATWLVTVTLNRCRTHRRRKLLTLRWLLAAREEPAPPADAAPRRDETSARVREAVAGLPAKDREVIVLYYLEALPTAEIAVLLNLSAGAVDVRLHRARRRLKESLGDLSDG